MGVNPTTAVEQLWEAHCQVPFPSRLRSVDVGGVELVMLDADVAGHVSSWLGSGGNLDSQRRTRLADRKRQLERVIPELHGPEAAYHRRLLAMAVLILDTSPEAR